MCWLSVGSGVDFFVLDFQVVVSINEVVVFVVVVVVFCGRWFVGDVIALVWYGIICG